MIKKVLVSVSGGMDSATALAEAVANHGEVRAACFDYGSKHGPYELAAAKTLCEFYGVRRHVFDFRGVMAGFPSALMADGTAVPEGHYAAESMRQTVVPGRNTIFTATLLGLAQAIMADEIVLGIHAGDHFIYPLA